MILAKNLPAMSYQGPVFNTIEKSVEDLIPHTKAKVFTLGHGADKAWQVEAFKKLQNPPKFILKAVPGAGKSFLTLCLCLDKIARNGYNKKALILVPQTNISNSFRDPCIKADGIKMIDTFYPPPALDQDFCDQTPAKMNKLRDFLCSPVGDLRPIEYDRFDNLLGITTHHNFICTWFGLQGVPGLTESQKLLAVKDLILVVDECHHICFDSDDKEMTDMGRILSEILDKKDPSGEVGLVTATYFRNDRKDILPDDHRKEFVKYSLQWDTYYPTLLIKEFSFSFAVYKQDPLLMIVEAIKKEPDRHHLVIMPHTGNGFRGAATLDRYLTELSKAVPDGCLLDMVTTSSQIKNFDKLNKSPDQYHVVVACDLFNEGTDWPPCDRIHNAAYSAEPSLPRLYQIIGRAFRKYPTKDSIVITNYIKISQDDDTRGLLSDHFNALMVSMMIDELFNPIVLPALPRPGVTSDRGISLSDILDDKFDKFREELTLKCELMGKDLQNPGKVRNMCRAVAEGYWDSQYFNDFGVSLDDFIAATCLLALRTKFVRNNGGMSSINTDAIPMDLSIIRNDFDKIWGRTVGGDMVFGTVEPLSAEVFKEVREIVSRRLASGSWEADKEAADGYNMLDTALKITNSPTPTAMEYISLVGTEVITPEGSGRVLRQNGDMCTVRIYKGAQEGFNKRVTIKNGGCLYVYRTDVAAWISKNFINVEHSCLPDKIKRGLITDAKLVEVKKAFDVSVSVTVCKPVS